MGGAAEDQFLEGSVFGASFWRWWNQAWSGRAGEDEEETAKALPVQLADTSQPQAEAPVDPVQELVYMASVVVARPRPPRRRCPGKSKPINIPTKKAVVVPIVDVVAEDKRYWYQ